MKLDLNCDLGEGAADESSILAQISSANVCCGFHSGSADVAHATIAAAARANVAIGAHPGFDDPEHFGRRELNLDADALSRLVVYQVSALIGLARLAGCSVRYIKPHGALYNRACRDENYARPIVAAAEFFSLPILALPNSALEHQSTDHCVFIREGFADRRYLADGSLVPRDSPNALLRDPDEAVAQAISLVNAHRVRSICVHGDHPHALQFVVALRKGLIDSGCQIEAFA